MKSALAGFATALFAAVAVATAPLAVASPEDDFINALSSGGISIPANATQQVVGGGRAVCQNWSSGGSYQTALTEVSKNTGGNASIAKTFIRAATNTLCPNYASKLP